MAPQTHATDYFEICKGFTRRRSQVREKTLQKVGRIINVCKNIEYDLMHGVTTTDSLVFYKAL